MAKVYGRRNRRRPTSSEEAQVDFSPEKAQVYEGDTFYEAKSSHTNNEVKTDVIEPLTSPFQSPIKAMKKRKLISPREKKKNAITPNVISEDIFELVEEDNKPKVYRSFRDSTNSNKKARGRPSKQRPFVEEEKLPVLNQYFVESTTKPTWSPKKNNSTSSSESLKSKEESPLKLTTPTQTSTPLVPKKKPALVRKLNFNKSDEDKELLKSQLKSPIKMLSRSQPSSSSSSIGSPKGSSSLNPSKKLKEMKYDKEIDDGSWDLLDSITDSKTTPKHKLLKKSMLRSPSKSSITSHEKQVLKYYSQSQSQSSQSQSNSQSEDFLAKLQNETPEPESLKKELSSSPKVKRTINTYGNQRSYLLEKDEESFHEEVNNDTDNDDEEIEKSPNNITQDIQTISHLRAQGVNVQLVDELNFIMEGIEKKNGKIPGLLDLSLKLFDNEFAKIIINDGLSTLHKLIDKDDIIQRFLLGFILCKVSEDSHNDILFDNEMIDIVNLLLKDNETVFISSKSSKNNKILFKQLKDKLNDDYTNIFFGLTLLLQNSLFINKEIYESLKFLIKENMRSLDERCYQMILILLEKFLNNNDIDNNDNETNANEFDYVDRIIKYRYELDPNIHILTLKLLIVLSVKKVEIACKPGMVDKCLRICSKVTSDDERLLYFGYLINLIEDERCFQTIIKKSNIKILHDIYTSIEDISEGYFGLLIGLIYTKNPTALISNFDRHELEAIQLSLQRFDSKGNKNVQLQVEKILTKFSI